MGCCVSNDLSQELTLEEIKDYNKLNSDIKQILNNKKNIDLQNIELLLKLINTISIKISNCEEIKKKVKLKKFSSKFSEDTIQTLNNNINKLNKYSKFLNEQIIETRKESLQNEKISLQDIDINDNKLKSNNKRWPLKNFIYYKKCIRRNTRDDTS